MTALWTVIAALGGGALGTWITAHYTRNRTQAETDRTVAEADRTVAETAEKITGVATALLAKVADTAEHREAQLLAEVRKLEVKVDHLSATVETLARQLQDAGITPEYPPAPNLRRHG